MIGQVFHGDFRLGIVVDRAGDMRRIIPHRRTANLIDRRRNAVAATVLLSREKAYQGKEVINGVG